MNRSNYYGFDLGTTNCQFYQFNGSDLSQVPNPVSLTICDLARYCLSTALLLDENQKVLACGERAYEEISNKQLFNNVTLVDAFKLCVGNDQPIVASDPNKRYSHQQALTYIQKLLSKVIERLEEEKPNCLAKNNHFIFTYPVHWGEIKSNGEIEGEILKDFAATIRDCFPEELRENIHFLPEPEAALLSLMQTKQLQEIINGYSLIIDIGGGTTDLVAGQLTSEGLQDIRYFGTGYGGNHFDEEIAQHIAIQFKLNESQKLSLDRQLRYYGRKFKESLSQQARINYNLAVTFLVLLADPKQENVLRQSISLTCAEFEQIVTQGKTYLRDSIFVALEKMELTVGEISQIILVGGGARLFIIPNILREIFSDSVSILYGEPPESAVARGATLWGVPKQLLNIPLLPQPAKVIDESSKIARENLRQQKYQQAIEGFTEVIQENPTNVPAYFNRGQARYQKGDIQGAINDWSQVVTMNPNDAFASYQLGVALLEQEDYQAAVMNFNQALSLNPQLADAYLDRGIAKYYLGQQEQAIKDFKQVLHISPGLVQNCIQNLKKNLRNMVLSVNFSKKKRLQDLIKTLESLLGYKDHKTPVDSFVDFIHAKLPQEPEVISVMTYREVVEYFVTERPSSPEIRKGAILRQIYPKNKELFVVYQVFLDGNNELVCHQSNGIPFGRKVLIRNFDEELSNSFQNKNLLIFE